MACAVSPRHIPQKNYLLLDATRLAAPVPKSKHFLLAILDALHKGWYVINAADALKHAQDSLISTAMQWAIQGTHRPCHCSVNVHTG